jgi:hypothetical protein
MLTKELVNYQDKLYWIYRKVKSSQIKEGRLNDLKEFWYCDIAVRNKNQNDDVIFFLREISEAVLVD